MVYTRCVHKMYTVGSVLTEEHSTSLSLESAIHSERLCLCNHKYNTASNTSIIYI